MADDLFGELGSFGDLVSGIAKSVVPKDTPEGKLLAAQSDIADLKKLEDVLLLEIGRQAYDQDPSAWPQDAKLKLIQQNIIAVQVALDEALDAQKQAEAEKAAAAARAAAAAEEARAAAVAAAARAAAAAEEARAAAAAAAAARAAAEEAESAAAEEEARAAAAAAAVARAAEEAESAAATVCSGCGAKSPEGTKFCQVCGTSLALAAPKFCTSCGTKLEPEVMFCSNCGARQS